MKIRQRVISLLLLIFTFISLIPIEAFATNSGVYHAGHSAGITVKKMQEVNTK